MRFFPLFLGFISISALALPKLTGETVRKYFWRSSPMIAPYESVTDARSIENKTSFHLKHSVAQVHIAEKEGRVFTNVDPADLPEGSYTFVILGDGNVIFGKDDAAGSQIGVRHFELAEEREVVAAGEYKDGRFNLLSSTYVQTFEEIFPGFEKKLAPKVEKFFAEFSARPIHYTTDRLLSNRQNLTVRDLVRYCNYPEFYNLHHDSICREIKWACESALSGP